MNPNEGDRMANIAELITALGAIPNIPDDVMLALEEVNKKSTANTDELVSSCIWTLAVVLPHILNPQHHALKELCLQLNPTTLSLSSYVRSQIKESPPQHHPAPSKPRSKP